MDHLDQNRSPVTQPSSLPDSATGAVGLVEDYLDRVFAPLVERVPYDVRSEWRAEMRSHVEASVSARIELGEVPAAAVERALRECGDPARISEAWLRAWPDADCVTPGKLAAFLCKSYGIAVAAALLIVFATGDRINYSSEIHIHALVVLFIPFVTGLWAGRRVAQRPVRAATLATICTLPATYAGYLVWSLAMPFLDKAHATIWFGTFHAVGWLIAGAVGSSIGALIRKGLRRRRAAFR